MWLTRSFRLSAWTLGACGLAACSPQQQATALRVTAVACQVDASVQPVLVAVVPTVIPAASPAASLDNAVIHPMIVAACASLPGSHPVAVEAAPVTTLPIASQTGAAPASGASRP